MNNPTEFEDNEQSKTYPVVKTCTLNSIPDGSFVLACDDCLKDSFISFDNSMS